MQATYRPFGLFRFVLAIIVVLSHSFGFIGYSEPFVTAIINGNVAVMGFFVLSGYIIAEAASTFYWNRPGPFLLNRFWRIAPPYWAALVVSIMVHAALIKTGTFHVTDPRTPTEGMFTLQNLWANVIAIFPKSHHLLFDVPGGFYGFIRFYWAIYIEMVFYLAAFLGIVVIKRVEKGAVVTALMVSTALLAHIISEYFRPMPLHYELAFVPYFTLGVSLYVIGHKRTPMIYLGFATSYGFSLLHFSRYVLGKIPVGSDWINGILTPSHAATIIAFAVVPFIVAALGRLKLSTETERLDRKFGDLSYPIYLNHFVVIVLAASLTTPNMITLPAIALTSILLSAAMTVAVERPIKPWRDRIRGRALGSVHRATKAVVPLRVK